MLVETVEIAMYVQLHVSKVYGSEYTASLDGRIFLDVPDRPYARLVGSWHVKDDKVWILVNDEPPKA